jgi:hypothetical protein
MRGFSFYFLLTFLELLIFLSTSLPPCALPSLLGATAICRVKTRYRVLYWPLHLSKRKQSKQATSAGQISEIKHHPAIIRFPNVIYSFAIVIICTVPFVAPCQEAVSDYRDKKHRETRGCCLNGATTVSENTNRKF